MTSFRSFTAPMWELFTGNLLLLACFVFYLVWWALAFKPGSTGTSAGAVFILAAFATGFAAILLLAAGINALSEFSKAIPVRLIFLGCSVLFFILMSVTSIVFHRIVTSELIIIHLWIALELSVVAVLFGTGRLTAGYAILLTTLIIIAFIVSMICYVLYYRLNGTEGYYIGMVPLLSALLVNAAFLVIMALSREGSIQ